MTTGLAIPPLADAACFAAWLRLRGVPVEAFGAGEAKTLAHLLGELRAGESRLVVADDGSLVRHVEGSAVIVLSGDSGEDRMVLVEDHQRFRDGRVRRRDLPNSVGEKLTPGEDPRAAALRAISEELGLPGSGRLSAHGIERGRVVSTSYPGLVTENVIHRFVYELPEGEWSPDGYRETQADKVTVFRWDPVLAEDPHGVRTTERQLWFAGSEPLSRVPDASR